MLSVDDFGPAIEYFRTSGDHDFKAQPILPFSYENQGVCRFSVCLYGSDDPPVLVDGALLEDGLLPHAESFSEFVRRRVLEFSGNGKYYLCAQPTVWDDKARLFLLSEFREGPVTRSYPGDINYLFKNSGTQISLYVDGPGNPGAEWNVSSNSLASLCKLVEVLVDRRYFDWPDIWSTDSEVELWLTSKKPME